MRDQCFIACHRGGSLKQNDHRQLAGWAAVCAELVLPLFEAGSLDDRPRQAIHVARAWALGKASVGEARQAAFAAHAAAREASHEAAVAAARAAGHAVATAHMADHCLRAFYYALKAVNASGASMEAEATWQLEQLPGNISLLVISGLKSKYPNLSASAIGVVCLYPLFLASW